MAQFLLHNYFDESNNIQYINNKVFFLARHVFILSICASVRTGNIQLKSAHKDTKHEE